MATTSTRSGGRTAPTPPRPRCSCPTATPPPMPDEQRADRVARAEPRAGPTVRIPPGPPWERSVGRSGHEVRMPGATRSATAVCRRTRAIPFPVPRTRENDVMSAVDTRSSARADAVDGSGATGNGSAGKAATPPSRAHALHAGPRRAARARGHRACCSTTPSSTWIPGGFLGVDVFFVISGYLITSLLLAEFTNTGHIGLGQFYLRRARRLLPALFLLLGVVALFAVVFLPDEVTKLRSDVVAALLYVHQLVADLPQRVVLRSRRPAAAAAAPVVARGRGAVLPDLAAACSRACSSSGTGGAAPMLLATLADGRGLRRVLMVGLDQSRLPDRRGPVARLLRHRHPGVHAAHRRGARVRVGAVAALGEGAAGARRDRARRASGSSGSPASPGCSSTSASSPTEPLPRWLRRLSRCSPRW